MTIRFADGGDPDLPSFLAGHGSLRVARRGELLDALDFRAVTARENGRLVGALTYMVKDRECEILTLHSARQWSGAGTALVVEVARLVAEMGCEHYWVLTTNDNVDALRFYQRRGFRISAIRCGAVDESRRLLKPEIPLVGQYGIPIRDEIELAQPLPFATIPG